MDHTYTYVTYLYNINIQHSQIHPTGIIGGIFLGMIEGVGIVINKATSEMYKPQAPTIEPDPSTVTSQGTIEGNTGGLAAFQ